MTQREVWLYLAKQWSKAEREGSKAARVCGILAHGLCESISRLRIDWRVADLMRDRVFDFGALEGLSGEYLWPRTVPGARKRAAFCREQAKSLPA